MNPSSAAYMLIIDSGSTVLKSVCYGKDLEKAMNDDTVKNLSVSYFRGVSTADNRLGYYDIFTFTNDENYVIPKNRVIGVSKLSPTHTVAFMDFIQRTTQFSPAKELPYFENHHLFETKN